MRENRGLNRGVQRPGRREKRDLIIELQHPGCDAWYCSASSSPQPSHLGSRRRKAVLAAHFHGQDAVERRRHLVGTVAAPKLQPTPRRIGGRWLGVRVWAGSQSVTQCSHVTHTRRGAHPPSCSYAHSCPPTQSPHTCWMALPVDQGSSLHPPIHPPIHPPHLQCSPHLLDGLVCGPGQLQCDVAPPPLVAHPPVRLRKCGFEGRGGVYI